eukprot:GHVS01059466.1.p1 GENE.GHVS01059466.1~~GHVS01059466.1.p1  ORF type:complete len:153 (+),score=13.01 GHVS01059466.1:246-704(+)
MDGCQVDMAPAADFNNYVAINVAVDQEKDYIFETLPSNFDESAIVFAKQILKKSSTGRSLAILTALTEYLRAGSDQMPSIGAVFEEALVGLETAVCLHGWRIHPRLLLNDKVRKWGNIAAWIKKKKDRDTPNIKKTYKPETSQGGRKEGGRN